MHNRRLGFPIDHITHRPVLVPIPDFRLPEAIQLPRAHRVEVDGKRKGDQEPDQRDDHGDVVILVIGHEAGERGEKGAARDGGDDPGRAALGVAAQAADREREDGGEDGRFEEEDDGEHGDPALAPDPHSRRDEDHDHGHEEHEDPPGLDEHHAPRGEEAADSEEPLRDGVAIGAGGVADPGAFDGVFDELGCDADLGPDVAELGGDTEEELVLRSHRLVDVPGETGALLRLQRHVRIRDLGERGEKEDHGQQKDERGDPEVGPLHVG